MAISIRHWVAGLGVTGLAKLKYTLEGVSRTPQKAEAHLGRRQGLSCANMRFALWSHSINLKMQVPMSYFYGMNKLMQIAPNPIEPITTLGKGRFCCLRGDSPK